MSASGNPTASHDVTVVLTPEQASHIAESILIHTGRELEVICKEDALEHLRTPEQFEEIRTLLNGNEARLEAIAWGKPDDDVNLALPRDRWEEIVSELMNKGADVASSLSVFDNDKIAKARDDLRQVEAAIAVWDQIQGAR